VGGPGSFEREPRQLLPERDPVDSRDERVQDLGAGVEDPTDLGAEVRLPEGDVLLSDDLAAKLPQVALYVFVGTARPDVVRPDEVEGASQVVHNPRDERVDLLVRQRPGREEELVAESSLVVGGVEQGHAGRPGHFDDCIPDRADERSHDERDPVPLDQLPCLLHRDGGIAGFVLHDELDLAVEYPTVGIDLLDGDLGAHLHRFTDVRLDPGERYEGPELERATAPLFTPLLRGACGQEPATHCGRRDAETGVAQEPSAVPDVPPRRRGR
jgi:hypothetical protein